MSAPLSIGPKAAQAADKLGSAREAITYFRPMEDREADHAPLSARLIRRIFTYTRPYAARRNWLFVLTFARGLQLPALAWMIGWTINGPIAGRDLPGIYLHAGIYLGLVLFMVVTLHFRQLFALELGEAVAHDMRLELFQKADDAADVVLQQDQVRAHHQPDDVGHRQRARGGAGRGVRGDDPGGADDRRGAADGVVQLEAVLADAAAGAGDMDRQPELPARRSATGCARCRRPGAG